MTPSELRTFNDFVTWTQTNGWLSIPEMHKIQNPLFSDIENPKHMQEGSYLIAKILENLNLRTDTREVLLKIQYRFDKRLTEIGVGI